MDIQNKTLPKIGIVIPCYNEEAALPITIPKLRGILIRLIDNGEISEKSYILCVDDGSRDTTWKLIKAMSSENAMIQGIALAHNRGHQSALLAGLMEARKDCDAVVSIDADLQDDPNAIMKMIELYKQGNEIVYGVRQSRKTDSWFKRNSARGFYKLQKSMGLHTVYDHADYRLMSKRALDILSEYKEQNLFLRGIIPQIGLQTAIVYYDRNERVAGESKYPLGKMLSFSIDGITSFTARPVRWIFMLGLIMLILDILVALYVFGSCIWGHPVSGWSSLMLSVWFLGSVILISIGIVGEYIGKIFNEVKQRPRYNIKEHTGSEDKEE